MNNYNKPFFILCLISFYFAVLTGCTSNTLAPIEEEVQHPAITVAKKNLYQVKAGDTLYSIAWTKGADYRELARVNNIEAPTYKIRIGQWIKISQGKRAPSISHAAVVKNQPEPIKPQPTRVTKINKVAIENKPTTEKITTRNRSGSIKFWLWPAKGTIVRSYSPNGGSKGIDIAGKAGSPILATAEGKVVYSGTGLRGYGDLIIIKHNEEFLSAYAHNSALLVKEGDSVKAGQTIAKMGNTDANQVMLHFEIRRAGKPVNPLDYLAKR